MWTRQIFGSRAGITIELPNLGKILQSLNGAAPAVVAALHKALEKEGSAILLDSKENYVPVRTGALLASGRYSVEVEGPIVALKLFYGGVFAPYAVYVHENLQAQHPRGQAKYLETPVLAAVSSGMDDRLADAVFGALKGNT